MTSSTRVMFDIEDCEFNRPTTRLILRIIAKISEMFWKQWLEVKTS
jgi:hypothetical protein